MIEEVINRIVKADPRKRTMLILAGILSVILIGVIIYVLFLAPKYCSDLECFQKASADCKKAVYMNEDAVSSWKYKILGSEGDECRIEVTLMNVKEGQLGMDKLVGYDMTCYTTGSVSYPERNLDICHGRLKEEMLNAIIEKLHAYVAGNIEEIGKTIYEKSNQSI